MEIFDILSASKRAIEEKGYLDLFYRKMIWECFGDMNYDTTDYNGVKYIIDGYHLDSENITPGLIKRVHLAKLCVEKVLPVWESKTNGDTRPKKVLNMTSLYLEGGTSVEALYKEHTKLFNFAYRLADNSSSALYPEVALVSCSVAFMALVDEPIISNRVNKYDTDDDLELDTSDAAYRACWIYAHDTYDEQYDKEREVEFWNWYVDEAVPTVLKEKYYYGQ